MDVHMSTLAAHIEPVHVSTCACLQQMCTYRRYGVNSRYRYILNVQRPIVGGAETRLMYSWYACTTDVNVSPAGSTHIVDV